MVQVKIAQLTLEHQSWREKLRKNREEFTQDKAKLESVASKAISKEQLYQIEHLHNQFHIQLINIHDMKQAIKSHERSMHSASQLPPGQQRLEILAEHERLSNQFESLQAKLQQLRGEFIGFLKQF